MKEFSAELCILSHIKVVSIKAADIQQARQKLQKKYSELFPEYSVSIRYIKELV